jgi:hypothetical protein
VIRFGSRQKHFQCSLPQYPRASQQYCGGLSGEGDVDFVKAIQLYKGVRYPYLVMPDHVSQAPGDRARFSGLPNAIATSLP